MTGDTRVRTAAPDGVQLRPITEHDLPFLAGVYASTREEELAAVPWSDEQKAAFLRWQFDLQHQYYEQYYPDSERLVIERADGNGNAPAPIGRLYVARWSEEIRVVDIAILPAYRGHGFGGALVRSIMDEARARGVAVSIHVEATNRALSLYRRLGFKHVDSNGVYYLMRWG